MKTLHTFSLTLLALLAFAANSILCRLALNLEQVSALDFTSIRLLSAASFLFIILALKGKIQLSNIRSYGNNAGAVYLFIYAAGFSYAYLTLSTATGALILFACVQFTMLFKNWLAGNILRWLERVGIILSLAGFIYFVYPELETPNLLGLILMSLAGAAWGMYSLIGAKSKQPLLDTAGNFTRLLPICFISLALSFSLTDSNITFKGLIYTLSSGVLASGLGYSIWYYVLPQLKSSTAAVSQLSVPIWAAFGGLLFINENISWHLAISSGLILGGITLVLLNRFSLTTK